MTPKEKAKELVDKYLNIHLMYGMEDEAKECALICVDEIIEELNSVEHGESGKVKRLFQSRLLGGKLNKKLKRYELRFL